MQAVKRTAKASHSIRLATTRCFASRTTGNVDSVTSTSQSKSQPDQATKLSSDTDQQVKKQTQAQLDEEMRKRLAELAGDGGEAGVEYENGQPVSMKRGVRENMFRYI